MFQRSVGVSSRNSQHVLAERDASDVVAQLRHSDLLSGFSEIQVKEIAELSAVRTYQEQDVVFNQGDPANYLYAVVTGNIALVRQTEKAIAGKELQVTVDILKAGQFLGWSALIEPHQYTVTARALGRVELIGIPSVAFNAWIQQTPTVQKLVLKNLNALLARRLHRAYDVLIT
jgi:CRP-like cAMP-binding protein